MARRSNGRAAGCRDPRAFVRAHAMPVVAVLAALVTCVAVPPDAAYAGYVHVGTLERIAAMLAVVGAMRSEGMIERLAAHVVARLRSPRALVGVLTALTGVASMFVTNDMALLALLPLHLRRHLRKIEAAHLVDAENVSGGIRRQRYGSSASTRVAGVGYISLRIEGVDCVTVEDRHRTLEYGERLGALFGVYLCLNVAVIVISYESTASAVTAF